MLSDIASIATLILFIIYFIGKIVTICRTRIIFNDEIKIELADSNKDNYEIIETFFLEDDAYNSFIITSKNGLYDLTVYKLNRDENFDIINRTKGDELPFLNIGQSLELMLTIPEILSNYELECYTPDYKKVKVNLYQNLKNGVASQSVVVKHTFKSWCYYLFK